MKNLYKKEYRLKKLIFDEISHVVVTSNFAYGQIIKNRTRQSLHIVIVGST